MYGSVLIVEDEMDISKLWEFECKRLGFEVVATRNVQEAKSAMRTFKFSRAILDLVIPGGSGEEIWEELQLSYPHIKVVIVSGHPSRLKSAKKHGAHCICKPCTLEEFDKAIL